MNEDNLVLELRGYMCNGEVAIESSVIGDPHEVLNAVVYGLVSTIRKTVCEETLIDGIPKSAWCINEYRKEYLQTVFKTAYEILRDEEQPTHIEDIPNKREEE